MYFTPAQKIENAWKSSTLYHELIFYLWHGSIHYCIDLTFDFLLGLLHKIFPIANA